MTTAVLHRTTITTSTARTSTPITKSTARTSTPITTSTARPSITIDPAELLVERSPSFSQQHSNPSNGSLAVFVFHTRHFVLANLQVFLIRKLGINLAAVEIFLDGPPSEEMRQVAARYNAGLHSLPTNINNDTNAPSVRNTNLVQWALKIKGKDYLKNGSAVLLLDGDVLPLTEFNSNTLLNSHDIVCRKHSVSYARFCWIGLICLAPQLYNTVDDFNVAWTSRAGKFYDAGGRTVEYLLKYQNTSFSWMKETILLRNDKELFWGAIDNDTSWIRAHFDRCDKCGPEIFFSSFNNSDVVFYHMISGTSEWRFPEQVSRRQSIYDSFMQSRYGLNLTNDISKESFMSGLTASVRKIQQMRLIPFHGNLTCGSVSKRLNRIVYDSIFTNRLILLRSVSNRILDQFCLHILPKTHDKIKWLNLESCSIERVNDATNYPNLNALGLHNVQQEMDTSFFTEEKKGKCQIYSYPVTMRRHEVIANNFPDGIFKCVREVSLFDERPFEYRFFLRLQKAFPFMNSLLVNNKKAQNNKLSSESNNNNQQSSIIEYFYLTHLNLSYAHCVYLEQCLLDTKMCLPSNVHLDVDYQFLKRVTHNVKIDEIRINCGKVRYVTSSTIRLPKHFRNYFL
ncbi:unnamed protein product [Rotaria sp. Silwood2]|nr:unnamed protein product [Rotaria sp. Silwood2]CAF4411928.1 unnamed protein product [Rotaria sp. Silwood2]